jgi:dinuclear metal center YbgI/SA1388 family protein
MIAEKIIGEIEKFAPLEAAAKWDNSGIQCISENIHISKMALCLDPSYSLIEKAINNGAHFILTHHPLLLEPVYFNKFDNYQKILALLVKNDLWLYSAHTSLDANPEGPVRFLAEALKLKNIEVLDPFYVDNNKPEKQFGYGLLGYLPKPITAKVFVQKLGALLDLDTITLWGALPYDRIIEKIAYCPGSGADFIDRAQEKSCDLYISGDIKYHKALEAKIPILDVGHHSLEENMMHHFYNILQNTLKDLEVFFLPSKSPMKTIILNNTGEIK